MPEESTDWLLRARDICKAYGGVVALRDASLHVRRGEIHALLGQNGAGKSTLIKCLAGTPAPDSGTIVVDGRTLPAHHSGLAATSAGLAFIHQEGALIDDLSVEENIALVDGYPCRFGMIRWRAVGHLARQALARMGVEIDPKARVAELPPASRTMVAIARALQQAAKIVVLDEPTASLGAKDVAALFRVLRRVSAAGGSIVFVSHRLEEVYDLCDTITVLRDGANVGTTRPSEISRHDLVTMICGHAVSAAGKSASGVTGDVALRAQALEGDVIGPVSFSVAAGEIVGFTGLSDAGHYELGEIAFGLSPARAGRLELSGKPFAPSSPGEAIKAGISYIPADRNLDGLARDFTLSENLFLNPRAGSAAMSPSGLMLQSRERAAAQGLLQKFAVRPPLPQARLSSLSGGNAQKVLVARCLSHAAPVLIVNDVSVGVDIGAREEIYASIRAAADAGAAVLVITSDFEEIETLCARAFVFVRGLPRAELSGMQVNVAAISACLIGGSGGPNVAEYASGAEP